MADQCKACKGTKWIETGTPGERIPCDCDSLTDLCEDCNDRPITGLDARCDTCRENANERAYDRSMEEPTYRGSEYTSELAESQARIQRELK